MKPDLVVIDESSMPKRVYLLELTCVWDSSTSFQAAMDRKMDRYERLGLDIEEKGYHVYNWPFEVGVRGCLNKRNNVLLETCCNIFNIKAHQKLKSSLAKISLLASHRIFLARRSVEWTGGNYIQADS